MSTKALLVLLLSATIAASAQSAGSHPVLCKQVRARYSIYANNDYLWVVGSHHLLVATDPSLDKRLEKLGWQDHSLIGDFTICSPNLTNPLQLTIRNPVTIKDYRNLKPLSR